jgi:hypothetical protein
MVVCHQVHVFSSSSASEWLEERACALVDMGAWVVSLYDVWPVHAYSRQGVIACHQVHMF